MDEIKHEIRVKRKAQKPIKVYMWGNFRGEWSLLSGCFILLEWTSLCLCCQVTLYKEERLFLHCAVTKKTRWYNYGTANGYPINTLTRQ